MHAIIPRSARTNQQLAHSHEGTQSPLTTEETREVRCHCCANKTAAVTHVSQGERVKIGRCGFAVELQHTSHSCEHNFCINANYDMSASQEVPEVLVTPLLPLTGTHLGKDGDQAFLLFGKGKGKKQEDHNPHSASSLQATAANELGSHATPNRFILRGGKGG